MKAFNFIQGFAWQVLQGCGCSEEWPRSARCGGCCTWSKGQSGASDAPGCEYSVSRILLLLFIVRSDFSAIFVSILGVHLLHRFFFGIMFECSVLWARLWFHSFLFHICYIFVKDFKILQVTTLFCLLCMEGVEKGREGSSFGDVWSVKRIQKLFKIRKRNISWNFPLMIVLSLFPS